MRAASAGSRGGRRLAVIVALTVAIAPVLALARGRQTPASDLFDSGALVEDLRALSADDMQGRRLGTDGSARARAYLVSRLAAAGAAPLAGGYAHPFVVRDWLGLNPRRGVNLVGRIEGRQEPDRYIVVSAHYDHIGVRGGVIFNGADDNASGTAALLAIAAYFRAHPPAHSILVVAFDGEELGLLGSRAFVRDPPVDRGALAMNVNIDMIGRDPDNRLFVVGTRRQPDLVPLVERVAARAPVTLLRGHDDPAGPAGSNWVGDSDQYAFLEAGIPALYFGVEDEDQHHRATDDFDTMTLPFYVRAVETLIDVVKEVDATLDAISSRHVR